MAKKLAFGVIDTIGAKGTSSWLTKAVKLGINLLSGIDVFKESWKRNEDPATAVAQSVGQSVQQIAANLRLQGVDPDTFFDKLGIVFPDNIDAMSADEINKTLGQVQNESEDPEQKMWLWALVGIVLLMVTGASGTRGGRRLLRRYRGGGGRGGRVSYRPSLRNRYRRYRMRRRGGR